MQGGDFEFERERLRQTKEYMQSLLTVSAQDLQAAQQNIREAMSNLEYIDSSDSFINILTNARFFEMARTQKESLQAVMKKPYFARIRFQRENEEEELLYIGKTSLFHSETNEPIIVDWRSPIANVYYDGRLGDITYDVRGEEHTGHLSAKRQYKIEDGILLDFRDVDLTTNDDLLQEALEGKADVRLTEIVSTIQKEQNEIIRAHLRQPILVQGAAGSGKTTIALHRISYFLYTMGQHFDAQQLMILAPNKLFIDYIGDVLPELGVEKMNQWTFDEYVQNATGLKLTLQNQGELLEELVSSQDKALPPFFLPKVKGSLAYRDVMDRYIEHYEDELTALMEDVYIEKYRILRGEHLQKLFLQDFHYMPIERRLERIKLFIQTEVKRKTSVILQSLNTRYEDAIGRALNGIRDAEKRKRLVTKYIDERDARIPQVQKEAKSTVTTYMKRFKKLKIKAAYRDITTNAMLLQQLALDWTWQQQQAFLQAHEKERWSLDDLAALYYLHARIKGIDEKWKMRVVFIDEVQDYSIFQLYALKAGLETDMFTMVGDLAQGIHSYKALTNWQPVLDLFPRATYATLQKSYRTTIEIMAVANKVLSKIDDHLPLVEPVVRHGNSPLYIESASFDAQQIAEIYHTIVANGHSSVALICKTMQDAIHYTQEFHKHHIDAVLLDENAQIPQNTLLIVPSYLAKGLEFDAVIIAAFDIPFYDSELDRKLLYVALTRAMHELYLIGPSKEVFLNIFTEEFEEGSLPQK